MIARIPPAKAIRLLPIMNSRSCTDSNLALARLGRKTISALDTPLRRPWVAAGVILVTVGIAVLLAGLLANIVASQDAWEVFWVSVLATALASLPAVVSLAYFDRRERESVITLTSVLAWGALGATTISSILVGIESTRVVKAFLNTPTVDAAVASGLGLAELLDLVNWVPTVLVSPVIEETVKALGLVAALWLLRGRFRGMRDGIILGALVGLGFGIVETASYMVIAWDTPGQPSIESELLNRFALFGLTGHALWTGLAGAGLGLARTLHGIEAKTAAVLAGLLAAVCGHALHNALGTAVWVTFADAVGVAPGESTSLPVAWALTIATWLVIEGPFMILMVMCLISSGMWERRTIGIGLSAESADIVTEPELAAALHEGLWKNRRLAGMPTATSRRLVHAQNRLALRRWSAERVGLDPVTEPGMETIRKEIIGIRVETQAGAPTPT